jgi:hypothetical protein
MEGALTAGEMPVSRNVSMFTNALLSIQVGQVDRRDVISGKFVRLRDTSCASPVTGDSYPAAQQGSCQKGKF